MSSRAATFIAKLLAASQQSQINNDSFRISDIFILPIFAPFIDSRVKTSSRVACFLNLNSQSLQPLPQLSLTYWNNSLLDVLSYCRYSTLCQLVLTWLLLM